MRIWGRRFLTAACAAGLFHGAAAWGQSAGVTTPSAELKPVTAMAEKPIAKVNINTADETALTALKGIGKVKAKAILEYRQNNGPFKTVDELEKVKGIGEKTVANLRDQLAVE